MNGLGLTRDGGRWSAISLIRRIQIKLCAKDHSQLPRSGLVQQAAAADAGRGAEWTTGGRREAARATERRRSADGHRYATCEFGGSCNAGEKV